MLKLTCVVALLLATACQTRPAPEVQLASGKKVPILRTQRLSFPQDGVVLNVQYQTSLNLDQQDALSTEASEVRALFDAQLAQSNTNVVIIQASKPTSGPGIVTTSDQKGFVFRHNADGNWKLDPPAESPSPVR